MPNGNPEFAENELRLLEAFFAPLAARIQRFAKKHNLKLDRYYHQMPGWSLSFRHPRGGQASIEISRSSNASVLFGLCWWIDDYDAGTRSMKSSMSGDIPASAGLTRRLHDSLEEILSWDKDNWSQVIAGYKPVWQRFSREEFEAMSSAAPPVRWMNKE